MKKVKWAFIFHSPGTETSQNRFVVEGEGLTSVFIPVHDNAAALEAAAQVVSEGIDFIELCGSFAKTPNFVDQVVATTHNQVPVGAVTFTRKAADDIAAIFKASTNSL